LFFRIFVNSRSKSAWSYPPQEIKSNLPGIKDQAAVSFYDSGSGYLVLNGVIFFLLWIIIIKVNKTDQKNED